MGTIIVVMLLIGLGAWLDRKYPVNFSDGEGGAVPRRSTGKRRPRLV